MKFTIKKSDIIDVLARIQGITSRKSNLNMTENVLVKSADSRISVAATDLETGFEGFYPAEIEIDGVIAINAKKLFEIVKNFPKDEIILTEVENRWLKIGNDTVEYNIVGSNPDDFPEIPLVDDVVLFEINSIDLKKMIEKAVMIGAASDEKRAHILGIHFQWIKLDNQRMIRMVSTDGKRLSKVDCLFSGGEPADGFSDSVIIPKKGLNEVSKFLDVEGNVQIGIKSHHFIIKKQNETIILGLLEGDFPQYETLLDISGKNTVELNKQDFKMMLKRMSILTSDEYKGVIFKFGDDKLTITTANPELGESKEDMTITYPFNEEEIAFNPYFFIDALSHINSDTVTLYIKNKENPCIIAGKDDQTFLSVIMPMKI
ncbi:MAG: DNA polymerase III subunit beta [Thermodesulfobacteriota bacterium]